MRPLATPHPTSASRGTAAVADVSGVLGFQLPQEHLRRDHLALKDLLYPTYQVFRQSVVESRTVLLVRGGCAIYDDASAQRRPQAICAPSWCVMVWRGGSATQ